MNRNTFIVIAGVILLFLAPFALGPAQLTMLNEIMIFSLFGLSFNLLLGYGGLLSFGHSMFLGFGAYTTGVLLLKNPGFPFLGLLTASTVATLVVGLAVGSILLKQKGPAFAILTMAIDGLFYTTALKWKEVTGGDDGICIFRPEINLFFLRLDTTDVKIFYYISYVIIGLATFACWYFTKTSMGQTILLVRDNEMRMQFMGYNAAISRLILFTISAGFAGLAGSFYMLFFGTVAHNVIGVDMTAVVLLMTFIGGIGNFFGPLLGSAFYIYIQDLLSTITKRWPFFMGIIFMAMVMFRRDGLAGFIEDIYSRVCKRNGTD